MGKLTLYQFQYRSEVETSGFSDIAVAACRQQRRANSAGVTPSSGRSGDDVLCRKPLEICVRTNQLMEKGSS